MPDSKPPPDRRTPKSPLAEAAQKIAASPISRLAEQLRAADRTGIQHAAKMLEERDRLFRNSFADQLRAAESASQQISRLLNEAGVSQALQVLRANDHLMKDAMASVAALTRSYDGAMKGIGQSVAESLAILPRTDWQSLAMPNVAQRLSSAASIGYGPHASFAYLERSRMLPKPTTEGVWAITCFFIARQARMQGVSALLLRTACKDARKRGGRNLEGYPRAGTDGLTAAAFVHTGLPGPFLKSGFRPTETAGARIVMRKRL
jgi:hypothetical protein